jgi:serine protease Do
VFQIIELEPGWFTGQVVLELSLYASGFPLGEPQYTITGGAISREASSADTPHASLPYTLMHTANIASGNSGGPLLSEDGKVVGLNYAGRIFDNQYFAISSAGAQPIVDQLMTGSSIDSIGINGEAFLEYVDGDPLSRVWIAGVQPNSLADEIGLKPGDDIF